jgi:hypothetical protein
LRCGWRYKGATRPSARHSHKHHRPEKKAQASLRDIKDAKTAARMTGYENVEITNLSQKLASLLQRASQTLQPENLSRMGRPEIKEFLLVLEEMKMLTSELEVIRLFPK